MRINKYLVIIFCGLPLNLMAFDGVGGTTETLSKNILLESESVLSGKFEIDKNSFLSEVIKEVSKKHGYKVIWNCKGDFIINNKIILDDLDFLQTLDAIASQFINDMEINVYTKNEVVIVSDA